MKRYVLVALALSAVAAGPVATNAPATATAPASATAAAPVLERRVFVVENGAERTIDAAEAVKQNRTLIDFSDDWTPFIFEEQTDASGAPLQNRYRSVFLGLAGDTGDGDGQPLPEGAHNYLELYGIPPTLGVLRARFLDDKTRADACAKVDLDKLRAVTSIPPRPGKAEEKLARKLAAQAKRLERERKQRKLPSLEALAESQPKRAKEIAEVAKFAAQRDAFAEVEKRLACEQLFVTAEKHVTGVFDEAMRQTIIRFQHKHKLYDAAALRPDTMAALGRTLLENDFAAFQRVMTERVTAAANVLEDGSVAGKNGAPTYEGASGPQQVRNLVDESLQATLGQLELDTPERVLAFFERHPAIDFKGLRGAVKLPAVPEYYAPDMDLSVVIDRGDVFYDPLFDENGKANNQTRHHFPMLVLRVKYRDKQIPLVRWRTTIGGWRSDLASNGYEYYRYKGSDVGPRVWRNVVSGPVWIAPNSTPIRTLVKTKVVQRQRQLVVNYDEVGPGYLSAYGLVAAYNVVPGKNGRPDWDNGVRVHGSSEILSIRNPDAYSHGCHRLMNHLAVRLFSFVLRHRPMVIEGDKPLDFARQFLFKEDVMEMRLPSRGYWFRLEPPLPVYVLEGNIVGKEKKPILTYMPKPGVKYPPGPPPSPKDTPESRAGGGE
jgi:hypothetical protein